MLAWIDDYISEHKKGRVPVLDAQFQRLNSAFSAKVLAHSYYCRVDEVQMPPLSQFGLEQFSTFEGGGYEGITFKNTYFVRNGPEFDESLHFHEMVHVVQWDELGAAGFLMLYASGLLRFGYRDSPLEMMAYDLQGKFEREESLVDCEEYIRGE